MEIDMYQQYRWQHDENFLMAVEKVLEHEGGYVNHPNDPGGETKYGISKRSYPNLNIRNLTVDQAKEIYYNDWWMKNRYYEIPDARLAAKVFDTAINMGSRQANKLLQRAAMVCGHDLVDDGILGRRSFAAIANSDPNLLLAGFRAFQWAYYRAIMKRNPRLKVFARGWKRRAMA
jgi:lysozyme family protein